MTEVAFQQVLRSQTIVVRSGHELLLPSELTLEVKPIEVNLEVGRNLVSGGPDAWVFGLATVGNDFVSAFTLVDQDNVTSVFFRRINK